MVHLFFSRSVILTCFLIITTLIGCTANNGNYNGFKITPSDIPISEIIHGGPERDGIPAINEPLFTTVGNGQQRNFDRNSLVIGVVISNQAKAYPLNILNWHEIVNDSIAGVPIVVTYCPLCRSGIVFNATVNHPILSEDEKTLSFGVSGLLYNNNLLFYDQKTKSLWSQIRGNAVTGELIGTTLEYIPSVITTWAKWRSEHANTEVLIPNENMNRDYYSNPYQDYQQSPKIIFPVSSKVDDSFPAKELVVGVVLPNNFNSINSVSGQGAKAYPFSLLEKMSEKNGGEFIDSIDETLVSVVWDNEYQEAKIFDSLGNELPTYTMYWFSWNLFYPESAVFKLPR